MTVNQNFNEEEFGKIDNITFSCFSIRPRIENNLKLMNNNEKIICEYFITKKKENNKLIDTFELVKTIEIDHKIWYKIINKLLKIMDKRKYFWNNKYSVGEYPIKDGETWKIIIKNKNKECIKISCDLNTPQEFRDILNIFIKNIYYEKIMEKKEL